MADPARSIGKGQTEASIDAVNIWMRSTPWYQQQMQAWGQDPGHPTLTKQQSQQILRMAQANGVQVDEGNDEIDNHGNFNPKGHKLRNTLIVAGIAAATIATMGAAGAFSGAAGAGSGAAGAGGGAAAGTGALGSTAIGTGMTTGIAGGTGLAGVAGTAAAHGGIGAFLASAGGLTLGKTLADTFTNIYGMKQQLTANRDSLNAQLESTKYATDAQTAANDKALAYQKEQDLLAQQRAETDRRANFDQYMARARGAQTLGDTLGFHLTLPDYVPGTTGSGGGATGPLPKVEDSGDIAGQVSAYFKSRGVSDQETPYWVSKWPELVARGKELGDPTYANKRLAAADIFGGSRGSAGTAGASGSRNTIGALLTPQPTAPTPFLDPNQVVLQAPPPGSYRLPRNTLGAYFGGR